MQNTDGMNLPSVSVLHLGMYYVSQIWANRVANVIPRIRQSGLGVVGANFTTSSSVNSDDESSVDSDDINLNHFYINTSELPVNFISISNTKMELNLSKKIKDFKLTNIEY